MTTANESQGTHPSPHRMLPPTRFQNLVLVSLALSSGAVDAISYLALGKVFTAFQTGNLVFLGLGLTGTGPGAVRPLISLAAFAVGVTVGAPIVRVPKVSRSPPLRVVLTLSLAVVAEVGFLAGWVASSGQPTVGMAEILIAASALAMGLQSAAVLSLGLPGVLTTAATATVIDLMSDVAGMQLPLPERGRLAGGVLAGVLVGAAVGALLLTRARILAPVFPLVAIMLAITACSPLQRRHPPVEDPSLGSP